MADFQDSSLLTHVPHRLRIALVALLACTPLVAAAQPMVNGYRTASLQPAAAPTASPQPIDECQMLAKIDGQVILAGELLWRVNLRLEEVGDRVPPQHLPQVKQQLLQQMLMQTLDMRMIYADFRRKAPQADISQIQKSLNKPFEEKEVPRLMEEVGVKNRDELPDRLLQLGTSLRQRREGYYKTMIARSWINESLDFSREVNHQQLLDYYHEHAADYEYPTQAKWEELMVSFHRYPDRAAAYRAIANMGNQVFAKVRQSSPDAPAFAEVAKQESHGFTAGEGGQQDWTTQGALTAERIDEALFTLPVGEMSPILMSDSGFHIVRVLERKLAGRTPFTEVQKEIRKKILDDRFNEAIDVKIAEMKRDAHIWTAYSDNLTQDADDATRR